MPLLTEFIETFLPLLLIIFWSVDGKNRCSVIYIYVCLFQFTEFYIYIRPEKERIFCFCWKNKINYLILTNDFKSLASLSPFLGFICILPIHLIMDFSGAISCGFKSKRSSYCAYPLGFSNVPFSMGIPDAIFSITWNVVSFPIDISW